VDIQAADAEVVVVVADVVVAIAVVDGFDDAMFVDADLVADVVDEATAIVDALAALATEAVAVAVAVAVATVEGVDDVAFGTTLALHAA
jgi:hypothetical protein